MIKRGYGFKNRFPFAGLFLIIAIAIAIPLTVWSLNNVSTVTKQQAKLQTCGINNQNPSCPEEFTCNNLRLGGNCILSELKPPTNLNSNSICKYNPNNPKNVNLSLNWDSTKNATGYLIFVNYYYMENGKMINVNLNTLASETNSYSLSIPVPNNVNKISWHVKAVNSVFNINSTSSQTHSTPLSCK